MSATRTHRTAQDWDELAQEIIPRLQNGERLSDFSEMIGSNVDAMKTALALRGVDSRGEALEVKPITAARRSTLAKRVADAKREGESWWMLKARTKMSYAELTSLLREFGYSPSGQQNGNGSAS